MVDRRSSAVGLLALAVLMLALPRAAGATTLSQRLDRQFTAAGGQGSALAVDLKSGRVLWARLPDTARIPASVNKLYTTAAALLGLGKSRRLETTVSIASRNSIALRTGTLRGNLYLRGRGDPTLDGTAIASLAKAVRAAGLRRVDGLVVGDESFLDSIRGVPAHGAGIDPNLGGAMSGLTIDHGASALQATRRFTIELRKAGVTVGRGRTTLGAPPAARKVVASHLSPDMATLARLINVPSDNFHAEMLTKVHGALALGDGSTAAGLKAAASALAKVGVYPRRTDGSGISRGNWTTPRTVVRLLSRMATRSEFVDSLALAGRSGTLSDRMRNGPAAGRCRAKTGTLSNVSALAGYCPVKSGGMIAFAMLNNLTSPWQARPRQDSIVQALAAWQRPAA